MHGTVISTYRNNLLSWLSPSDRALIEPHLTPVDLPRAETLVTPGVRYDHALFPDTAVGSIIAISPEGHEVEAGLFGRDGVSPAQLILGVRAAPYRIIIQVAGTGHRMPADALVAALNASPTMRDLFNRYLQTLTTQMAYTALSNAIHQIDERCARWLLMVHDRVEGDEIRLTHEFLSLMLAVRRPSVTTALHVLEGNRLIRADRGWVTIRNRAALEEFAGDAYGRSENEYRDLLGPL